MAISEQLKELNLISGKKLCTIFDRIFDDVLTLDYGKPSSFIDTMWERYENSEVSLNGSVFEGLLATVFYREGIVPLFVQAKLTFVPNIDFDFVAYSTQRGPIVISAKTSLRERYKQADLEGMMLRHVHRRSESYLITMHVAEAARVNAKIAIGQSLGIDKVVVANSIEFDGLIDHLKTYNYVIPDKVDVLTSSRVIVPNAIM